MAVLEKLEQLIYKQVAVRASVIQERSAWDGEKVVRS